MNESIVMVASYGGPYAGNFIPSLIAYDEVVKELGYRSIYIFPDFVSDYTWVTEMRCIADKLCFIPYNQYSWDNVKRIRQICKEEKAVLIYSRMSGWDIAARFAMPGLPLIWHMEMELDLNGWKQKLKYFIKYKVLGFGCTYHVAISEKTTHDINCFSVLHRCKWIPNGISTKRLKPKQVNRFQKPVKLLTFAYQPFVKGLDIALDACEELNRMSIDYYLLVSAQKATYKYINERYREKRPSWIVLVDPKEDISELYDEADILLSPSRFEGFSYCLAESLYSGLPVVYSDVPGTRWADEMKLTYMFKTGDSHDLAIRIKECTQIGVDINSQQFNRELIEQRYSLSRWSEMINEYIRQVLREM